MSKPIGMRGASPVGETASRGWRARFDPIPGRHRPRSVRNGVIFLAILGLIVYSGYTRDIPLTPAGGKEYRAEFDKADYIRSGTPVRVGGVEVGKVKEVDRQKDGSGSVVTFRVDDDDVDVKSDARANLWWKTLLGFNYEMELIPGSKSAPDLDEGGTIRQERTLTQVGFDEVFRPLDDGGRAGFQTFIRETGAAFKGDAAGEAIDELGPATESIAPAMDSLRGVRRGDLARLVDRTGVAMRAASRAESELAGLIQGGASTLTATGAEQASLARMVADGPETLAETRTTMTRLRTTLDELDPLARELRPGAKVLDEASREGEKALAQAEPLLRDARPTFENLAPALNTLRSASADATPLMDAFQGTLDRSGETILPYLERTNRDTSLKNYAAIGPFFAHVGSIAARFSSHGHQVHFNPGATEHGIRNTLLPCSTHFTDPTSEELVRCKALESVLAKVMSGGVG